MCVCVYFTFFGVCVATRCRVSSGHLADDVAMGDMKTWSFLNALPSGEDMVKMQYYFSVILGRILSVRLNWMLKYDMSSAANVEIEHQCSKEQPQKSEEVCNSFLEMCAHLCARVCLCICMWVCLAFVQMYGSLQSASSTLLLIDMCVFTVNWCVCVCVCVCVCACAFKLSF